MGPALDFQALTSELRAAIGSRRIQHGFQALASLRPTLDSIEPRPGSGVLTGLVAQWVDAGFDDPSLLDGLLQRFPRDTRAALSLIDYLHLRMAEAAVAMAHEEFDRAAASLETVLSFAEEIEDPEMFAIANFWAGRCYRKRGRYDQALHYTERAEQLALNCGYAGMAAIIQVALSWLAFQRGRLHDAITILCRAEQALDGTDDLVNRGNVQSAYGRIARRQGKYEIAIGRFERAIREFRNAGAAPLQLARTLVNMAFVKRLAAAELQKEADRAGSGRREHRARIEQIRAKASECLAEAAEIYRTHRNHHGIATVRITEGFLRLDSGDLDRAVADAADAFNEGSSKRDLIIMSRARTLQCVIEHAALDEQVGDPALHRDAAERFARDAVEFAAQTESRRLRARALVWQGLTFTLEPADLDAARRCCEAAAALLQPEAGERQEPWDDLETLKSRLLQSRPVDRALRAWCAGQVEGQSFQEITEEFARIVIPRVWERQGRKVSRVAEKLSISPKKVRRILQSVGLKEQSSA